MANYAVRLPRLSAADFAGQVPLYPIWTRAYLEQNPQAAYELWMTAMQPSISQRTGLQRLFDTLYQRYQALSALQGPEAPDWVGFLSTLDPNRYLSELTPYLRGIDMSRYQRPLRWYAFS